MDEKSIAFLRDIIDETVALFPGKYIHFGGDEAPKNQWNASPFVQDRIKKLGLKNSDELQSWLFAQMAAHIAKKGRVAVGWEEITHGFVPEGAVVMPWISAESAIKIANSGHPVILCTVAPLYFDSAQSSSTPAVIHANGGIRRMRSVYEFNCNPPGVDADKQANVLGAQCQLWTEMMTKPEHMEWNAYPRATALAEATWSTAERKNYPSFLQRMAVHVKRLDMLKVNYHPLEAGNVIDWSPATISPAKKDVILENEISVPLEAGTYEATIMYESGKMGLWCDAIDIVVDGKVVATDQHRGFTGLAPKNPVYRLVVKAPAPAGAKVLLRVHADSSEGTDSTGGISLKRE